MSNGAKLQKLSWELIDGEQPERGSDSRCSPNSQLVGRVLGPALQLWLRSLLDRIEDLQVQIAGGTRQILGGEIPRAAISASGAVYQGLHLSGIDLEASGIRIDIGQILKGKPLQPLEPFPVKVRLYLSEADLNASLDAPLLQSALSDFLLPLLSQGASPEKVNSIVNIDRILLGDGCLSFWGIFGSESATSDLPGVLHANFRVASPNQLLFTAPELQTYSGQIINLQDFHLDLGSEVAIEELTIAPGQAICQGRVMVIPRA